MKLEDRDLICSSCAGRFVFTAGEQEMFLSRGLKVEPDRCPPCGWLAGRRVRREREYAMDGEA